MNQHSSTTPDALLQVFRMLLLKDCSPLVSGTEVVESIIQKHDLGSGQTGPLG